MSDQEQATLTLLNIHLSELNEEGLKIILSFTRAFAREKKFRKAHS